MAAQILQVMVRLQVGLVSGIRIAQRFLDHARARTTPGN